MGDKHGILHLSFENRGNKTIASNVYFQGALRVIRPQYDPNGQIRYIIVNPGGGYLQGDRYDMQLNLKNRADVHLTTQAATKIYRTDYGKTCQETTVQLSDESILEYLPDPIIPYAGSHYVQHQTVEMDDHCSLFLSEIMTGGYDPNSVPFSFDAVDLTTKIFYNQRLKVFDRLHFHHHDPLDSAAFMDGFSRFGSVIAVYPTFAEGDITALRKSQADLQKRHPNDNQQVVIGVTRLPIPGFIIRFLGNHTQIIEQHIQDALYFFRCKCGKGEQAG